VSRTANRPAQSAKPANSDAHRRQANMITARSQLADCSRRSCCSQVTYLKASLCWSPTRSILSEYPWLTAASSC
jgi:hypothetical protein